MCVFFFYFKQKTAYEMRISDWSSDVCSSDLSVRADVQTVTFASIRSAHRGAAPVPAASLPRQRQPALHHPPDSCHSPAAVPTGDRQVQCAHPCCSGLPLPPPWPAARRSEEHTSELQSLMRISYAVFCLKKTTQTFMIATPPLHQRPYIST